MAFFETYLKQYLETIALPEWALGLINAYVFAFVLSSVVLLFILAFWGYKLLKACLAIAGAATTGLINNAVNFVYYTWISDGVSDLTPSSYNVANSGPRYINRWDRLDYAKQETGQSYYNFNAWMYYSEYNFHMHIWNLTWWAKDKDVFLFSYLANSASVAAVDSTDPFSDYNYYMERNQPIMAILRTIAYMATGRLGI